MDAILQGLSGIFEVVLMAGLGFFLAKKGWFWENAAKNLTKRTMTVALPPLMIHSLYANFTHDALIAAAPDLVLPFVSIFASYLAGHVLASVLHISKGHPLSVTDFAAPILMCSHPCFISPRDAAAFLSVPAALRMPSSSACR